MKNSTVYFILRFGVAAAFIMPMIVSIQHYIFPFVVPKIIFLRILVALLLFVYGSWVLLNWKNQQLEGLRSPILWAVIGFLSVMTVSAVTSVDVMRSFWDNHERMLGVVTMFHYGVLYYIARQVFTSWKQWQVLLGWSAVAAAVVFWVGYIQVGDPTYLLNQGSLRVRSTLGNTIYVSGYAMFATVVSVILAWYAKVPWQRYVWIGLSLFSFGMVLITRTRGTWLGIGIAAIVTIIVMMISRRIPQKWRRISMIVGILGVISIGSVFAFRDTAFVQGNDFLRRATDTQLAEGTARTRIMAWQVGLAAWEEHKLLGWGPNTFFYGFNKHYNPEFLRFGISETWFDSAHNVVINTMATQGVLGLLGYLGLFIAAWIGTVKMVQRDEGLWILAWGIRFFLLAHFIHNLFVFESTTSYLYFFTVLACVDSLGYAKQGEPDGVWNFSSITSKVVIAGMAAVLGFGVFRYTISPAQANMSALQSLQLMAREQFGEALMAYTTAKETYSQHQDDIVREISKNFIARVNFRNPQLMQQFGGAYPVLIDDLKAKIEEQPLRLRSVLLLSNAYQQLAIIGENDDALNDAIVQMEHALSLSPHRQQIMFDLSQLYLLKEDKEAGLAVLQKAIAVYENIAEAHVRLGIFHAAVDEPERAIAVFRAAYDQFGEGIGNKVRSDMVQLAVTELARFGEVELANQYQALLSK